MRGKRAGRGGIGVCIFSCSGLATSLLLWQGSAQAQTDTPVKKDTETTPATAPSAEGVWLTVSKVLLKHPEGDLPIAIPADEEVLRRAVVYLQPSPEGWREAKNTYTGPNDSPRAGDARLTVSEIGAKGAIQMSPLALYSVLQSIVRAYGELGVGAVWARMDSEVYIPVTIDEANPGRYKADLEVRKGAPKWGDDLRRAREGPAATELWVTMQFGRVSSVSTRAEGGRFAEAGGDEQAPDATRSAMVNRPEHAWILNDSPVSSDASNGRNIVLREEIEAFTLRANRYGGRRVDAALSPGEKEGEVAVEYLVNEVSPWTIYAGISNTGSESTGALRERFGVSHSQLTNNDDRLSIDYTTANFEDSHAVNASYDFPIIRDSLRAMAYGQWATFTASDLAQSGLGVEGTNITAGAELAWTVYPGRKSANPLFVDLIGGARWTKVHFENKVLSTTGDASFLFPYMGARAERNRLTDTLSASVRVELNPGVLSGESDLGNLGRLSPDSSWTVVKWQGYYATFLEPLFRGEAFRNPSDKSIPTMAHEVAFSVRGQHSFGHVLIPTEEDVVGGFYSVRGYPESILAGDDTYLASAEYRWHIPWNWAAGGDASTTSPGLVDRFFGGTFRVQPVGPYGRADWDLILRGFVDYGRAKENGGLGKDETIVGTGVGLELVIKRNLSARGDLGFPLEAATDANNKRVDPGDPRVHFSVSFSY